MSSDFLSLSYLYPPNYAVFLLHAFYFVRPTAIYLPILSILPLLLYVKTVQLYIALGLI
jgi:hypothetical protein